MEIGDAGNRRDQPERAIPFAGVANRIVVRSQHQAWQPGTIALVSAADIADRVEMRAHPGRPHPPEDQFSRRAMLPGQEDAGEVRFRLGDRAEFVDPIDDLLAEDEILQLGRFSVHLAHAFPMTNP